MGNSGTGTELPDSVSLASKIPGNSVPVPEFPRCWLDNPDLRSTLLLLLVGVLFFSDFLFSSKNFYFRDILNFHYPLRRVLIDSYARGEFPLWNPYVYLGQPILANPNYMTLYPTNLLHLLFPFNYAFKLHFILHPLVGGLGTYFLQRRLGIVPVAAFGGALAYQLSGTVLSFLNLYNIVPAVALMPWAGWAFLGCLGGEWLRRCLLFGAILGLEFIAFEPLVFQCTLLLSAGLAFLHWLDSRGSSRAIGRISSVLLAGGVFGFLLAAVQVLPALELLPLSARGGGLAYKMTSMWSMNPMDFAHILFPNLFGDPYTIDRATYWGEPYHDGRVGYLVSFFAGSCALLLAAVSFFSSRRILQRMVVCLLVASGALALGKFNPLNQWLYERLTIFRLGRYPSKYFLLGSLAIAVLAALGLEVILKGEGEGDRRRKRIRVLASVGIVLGIALTILSIHCQARPVALDNWIRSALDPATAAGKDFATIRSQVTASIRSAGVFLFLSSALILLSTSWRRHFLSGALLIVVLAAELIPPNFRLSPLISESDVSFEPEVNAYIREKGPREPYRVVSPTLLRPQFDLPVRVPNRSSAWLTVFHRLSGLPLHGVLSGLQYSLDISIDELNTLESDELWKACSLFPETMRLNLLQKLNSPMILALSEFNDPRLRYLASFVSYSHLKVHLYWLENSLSRAYFVSGVEPASTHQEALRKFLRPDFRFGEAVVLEDLQLREKPGGPGAGVAGILEYRNNEVLCEVNARIRGYLVLLDSYYPGWCAYLDGERAPILRANFAFRAVEVPQGKHRVEFRYSPRAFYVGLAMTCLALLSVAVFLVGQHWWRKRKGV